MEYITEIDSDGIVHKYPVLTEEEKEDRKQEFLRIADRIIEKYKKKEKEAKCLDCSKNQKTI